MAIPPVIAGFRNVTVAVAAFAASFNAALPEYLTSAVVLLNIFMPAVKPAGNPVTVKSVPSIRLPVLFAKVPPLIFSCTAVLKVPSLLTASSEILAGVLEIWANKAGVVIAPSGAVL